MTRTSTEGAVLERPPVAFDCNECNEALTSARTALATARRLALVAENALLNGDLPRARTALAGLLTCDEGSLNVASARHIP